MYDLLLSAQNARLMKDNPTLAKMILEVKEAGSTDTTSSSSASSLDLTSLSASDILSIVQKYKSLSADTSTETGSSSQVDETL